MLELSSGTRNCFQLSLTGIFTSIFNIYRNGLRAKMLFGWGKLDITLRKGNGHPGAESYNGQVEQAHRRGGAKDPSDKTRAYHREKQTHTTFQTPSNQSLESFYPYCMPHSRKFYGSQNPKHYYYLTTVLKTRYPSDLPIVVTETLSSRPSQMNWGTWPTTGPNLCLCDSYSSNNCKPQSPASIFGGHVPVPNKL